MNIKVVKRISRELKSVCIVDTCHLPPIIVAAFIDGKQVGAAFISPYDGDEILGIGVLPNFRRRGIAKSLWRFVAKRAGVAPREIIAEATTDYGKFLFRSMQRE